MRHALALTLEKLRAVWPTTLKSRFGWAFFASVVTVLAVVMIKPAGAEVLEAGGNWLINQIAQIMLAVANLSIGLCIFFLRFFIAIASYNNYIDVDVVQLGWVMVRDVANMFFVVALLVIAFGTILGLEEYEWKKNLVKLIFAAIFINFSNLIAQLFIDVAHVFTMTFLNAISATAGGNLINMFKLDQITQMVGVNPDVNTEFNVEILAGTMIAALFAVLAAFVMGSYVYVMMARVVSLWALIILSPLAYILGVLPKTQSYAERWWSEFSNNVIVAPIMVFFLWLAFATLGTGNILASIQEDIPDNNRIKNNQSVQLIGSNFVDSSESSKISLSKVSTWENMANFLIALAFLRVGVKTTEETGVWGSDMISDAWSFGKKAATIATGVAAARWITGKGTDTLKTGASRAVWGVPLVGGRALTNYGNRAKLLAGNVGIRMDNWAKNLEEPSKKLAELDAKRNAGLITADEYNEKKAELGKGATGVRKLGNLLLAGIVQTGGRADKKSQDWEKAVEAQKTYIEENYSTSSSAGGVAKLDWGIKAHAAETMASAKKDQKYAEGEELMLKRDKNKFGELKQKYLAEGLSEKDAAKEAKKDMATAGTLFALEDTTFAAKAKAERAKGELKIESDEHLEAARRGAGVYDVKNKEEKAAMDLAEEVARSRAAAYGKSGDPLRANAVIQAALNERLKKDGELFATMGYDELMSQEEILTEMIGDEMKKGNGANKEKLQKLRKQKVALATLNSKMDPDISRDSRSRALAKLGITEMGDGDRMKNELSRFLGTKIDSVEDGEKMLKEVFGGEGDSYQAALGALSRNFKTAGSAGDAGGLGLISAKANLSNGTTSYSLKTADHTNVDSTAAFAQYMTLSKINDITGLTGSYSIDANGDRKNTGISPRGKAVLKELFSGKDSRAIAQVNPKAMKQLDATEINDTNRADIKEVFDSLKSSMGNGGYEALIKMLPNLVRAGVINGGGGGAPANGSPTDKELRDAGVFPA